MRPSSNAFCCCGVQSFAGEAAAGLGEGWITVKIVLTDEVGNKQEQLLSPLFYYGDLSGINNKTLTNNGNSVAYPNPFNEIVTIELDKPVSGEVYFEVYDITGRIISQKKFDAEQKATFTWNGSHVKAGVYFYGIYNQGNVITGKIVKE